MFLCIEHSAFEDMLCYWKKCGEFKTHILTQSREKLYMYSKCIDSDVTTLSFIAES